MSASQYRRQLERKRSQRVEAEKKAGEYRSKESKKRAEADKARQAAAKTKSESTAKSKLREAERRDGEAAAAGKEARRLRQMLPSGGRSGISSRLTGGPRRSAQHWTRGSSAPNRLSRMRFVSCGHPSRRNSAC